MVFSFEKFIFILGATKGCRGKFHVDCLRNTNQIEPHAELRDFVVSLSLIAVRETLSKWFCFSLALSQCQVCKFEEQQQECFVCHKVEKDVQLLICEVCSRSAHMECVGLTEEPRNGEWFCQNCANKNPHGRSIMARVGGGVTQLGNVDICYVCQRGRALHSV